jgi:hypothetical protein
MSTYVLIEDTRHFLLSYWLVCLQPLVLENIAFSELIFLLLSYSILVFIYLLLLLLFKNGFKLLKNQANDKSSL